MSSDSRGRGRLAPALALLLLAAVALPGGCAKDRRAEIEELRAAIEAVNARFSEAFARRDVTAIGQLYTADAQALPPGMAPVDGRAAIQDMWKGVLAMPVGRFQLTTHDVDGNGETAWETGHYTIVGSNGTTMDEGKYVVIWKREPDGWKLYRDMWSSNSPQADATGATSLAPPAAGN